MRKASAILFLTLYLFSGTEFRQLAKLSAFVSHFAEHRAEDKDMTLVKFIGIHYFNGNTIDDDYAKDRQLPFKTTDSHHFSNSYTVPPPLALSLPPGIAVEPAGLPLYKQPAFSASHLSDIWQPPKAC